MIRKLATCLIGFMPIAGCAIHPIPDWPAGVSTVQLVEHIRCEARQALAEVMLEEGLGIGKFGQQEVDAFSFAHGKPHADGRLDAIKARFAEAAIALDFKLTMTETNKASLGASLNDKFNRGYRSGGASSGSLPLSARLDRTRQNERMFVLVTNFDDMFEGPAVPRCESGPKSANFVYPIAGAIGIKEVVQTFVTLARSGALRGKEGDQSKQRMVDTLTFTTDVDSMADPAKLTLAPFGVEFALTEVRAGVSAGRKDVHQVGISVSAVPQPVVNAAEVGVSPRSTKKPRSGPRKSDRKAESRREAVDGFVERDFRRIQESLTEIQRRSLQ